MTTAPTQRVAVYTDTEDSDVSSGVRLLEAAGFTVRMLNTRDPQEIIAGAADAEVLLPGYAEITREIIEALPNLRLVALMSMGFDYVDIEAATEHNVWVTNVPGAATEEVATHALAILLHATRQLPFYLASATPELWNERAEVAPPRLSETTLGIVGLGKIGRELARLAGSPGHLTPRTRSRLRCRRLVVADRPARCGHHHQRPRPAERALRSRYHLLRVASDDHPLPRPGTRC